jgi:protein-tyrosine-phosphatase
MNVLFVCEDNSALSIMAEAILNTAGAGRFSAFSAGCRPRATLSEQALDLLSAHELPIGPARVKGLEHFRAGEPRMDFIITLCDAAEPFADWPGQPFVAHWNVADRELRDGFWTLRRRIDTFVGPRQLNRRVLQRRALRLEGAYL